MSVAIAILAAGKGSRFGGDLPKPLVKFKGRSLIDYALDAALKSQLNPVFVVLGYEYEQIIQTLPPNVHPLYNPDWISGMASSLQTVLETVGKNPKTVGERSGALSLSKCRTIEAICIGLADQPFIGSEAYTRLQKAYIQGASLAVATYNGVRQNPVLLSRCLWPEIGSLKGDRGAKVLMDRYPVVEVPCEGTGNAEDIDTMEDLKRCLNLDNIRS